MHPCQRCRKSYRKCFGKYHSDRCTWSPSGRDLVLGCRTPNQTNHIGLRFVRQACRGNQTATSNCRDGRQNNYSDPPHLHPEGECTSASAVARIRSSEKTSIGTTYSPSTVCPSTWHPDLGESRIRETGARPNQTRQKSVRKT